MKLIIDLFAPLLEAAEDKESLQALLEELGWEIQLNDTQAGALRDAMAIPVQLGNIATIARAIIATREITHQQAQDLIGNSRLIFETVKGYANGDTLGDLTDVPPPFDVFQPGGDWQEMALRLPDYLITNWLITYLQPLYEALHALGVIAEEEVDPRLPPRRSIDWDALGPAMSDPVAHLTQRYGWPDDFDVGLALENLNRLLASFGIYPAYRALRPALVSDWMAGEANDAAIELEALLLDKRASFGSNGSAAVHAAVVLGTMGDAAGLTGIALTNYLSGSLSDREPLAGDFALALSASGDADRALDLRMRPSGIEVVPGQASADIRIAVEGRPEAPWRLIGAPGKAGLELAQLTFSVATELSTNGHDIEIAATTAGEEAGLRIIVAPGDGDGFIGEIFGDTEFVVTGDLGARWSLSGGFRFDAGLGFDILIPIDFTLGPIGIDALRLKMLAGFDGITLDAAVTGGLDISVMQVAVEEIGLRALVSRPPESEQPGNIGPLDLAINFLPPKGLGLTIDAGGIVTGGGYLFHDAEAGEYAGVGQVAFTSLKLTAIGMLSTRLPDNEPGWSLFLSVFSEFPPIQLGFGITLNGVGGLVGLHRTFDDEALRARLKDGALESIMFPSDPIANAPQILSDLRAIFPVSNGQFVFGVMCRLGWGTPTLVTADLGVIVEFPDPIKIALLGRIGIALPDPEAAIVELNMDVFGVVNLTEKTFALDATLRDSHVLHLFQLSGDMAMRMSWGDAPNMLVSMGGFHPDFVPPEGTPNLARLRAALPLGDNAAVELKAYVAITSNTFQTGGRLDVWVRVAGFNAEGWFSFDALIQFDPFGFEFLVTFGVSVSKGNTTLLGVDVFARVTGPGLWVVDGEAKFKFLGVKKSISVDITVGERKPEPVTLTDVAALVGAALAAEDAVQIPQPEVDELPVLLVERSGARPVLPSARLELWQKVVPFDEVLEKYATGGIAGASEFRFETIRLGDGPEIPVGDEDRLEEWFAPAAFKEIGDDEELASPSYRLYPAGLAVSSRDVFLGQSEEAAHVFETVTIDPELNERRRSQAAVSEAPGVGGTVRPGAGHGARVGHRRVARAGRAGGLGAAGGGTGGNPRTASAPKYQLKPAAPVRDTMGGTRSD
ncbi:DUF6603 domain-containing protein [Tropicimonas marinistellae]|uniref:DUF6603 domain-containing protein n=1 Tax=Tropicimonas marinistellae TaxID=1739787 RepID=UPI00082E9185|nr:DUF6603 domain-containing protein [Tropicimonas marinistellae]